LKKLKKSKQEAHNIIEEHFKELIEGLTERREQLKNDLLRIEQEKINEIMNFKSQLEAQTKDSFTEKSFNDFLINYDMSANFTAKLPKTQFAHYGYIHHSTTLIEEDPLKMWITLTELELLLKNQSILSNVIIDFIKSHIDLATKFNEFTTMSMDKLKDVVPVIKTFYNNYFILTVFLKQDKNSMDTLKSHLTMLIPEKNLSIYGSFKALWEVYKSEVKLHELETKLPLALKFATMLQNIPKGDKEALRKVCLAMGISIDEDNLSLYKIKMMELAGNIIRVWRECIDIFANQ